jgi:hypothetical protein
MDLGLQGEIRRRWHSGCTWFIAGHCRSARRCFSAALEILPTSAYSTHLTRYLYLCAAGSNHLQRTHKQGDLHTEIERNVRKSLYDNLPLELMPRLNFDNWWAKTRDRANLDPVALGMSRLDLCDLFGAPHQASPASRTCRLPTFYRYSDVEFHFEQGHSGRLRLIHHELPRPRLRVV